MNNKKIVVVLAGGLDQVELVKSLKNEGCFVHIADYTPSPIAADFADEHHQISTLDVEAVTNLARELKAELVVTACTDQALCIAAEVSETLGLPFPVSYQQAKNLTNKIWMKNVFVENGIPSAKYKIYENGLEGDHSFIYPVVVKPVDCNSSKGVTRVDDASELSAAFDLAKSLSRSGAVIIEEFMTGKELSIDGFVDSNQQAHLLLVTENVLLKKRLIQKSFPISASVYPVIKDQEALDGVEKLLQDIAYAFDVINTPLLVQCIMDDEGNIKVIELSARTGGGLKHKLIKRISGVDVIEHTVAAFLGKQTKVESCNLSDEHIVVRYLFVNPGEFQEVSGFSKEFAEKLYVSKKPGTKINGNSISTEVIGNLLITAKSKDELLVKLEKANNELKAFDTKGNNILVQDSVF